MEIQFDFISEKKLLLQRFLGNIDRPFLIRFMNHLNSNYDLSDIHRILIDVRHCKPVYNSEDVQLVSEFRIKQIHLPEKVVTIILSDSPETTVFSILYERITHSVHNRYEVCSTTARAVSVLYGLFTEQELEQQLKVLKHQFV